MEILYYTVVVYILIGIIITELTCRFDNDYKEAIGKSFLIYLIEIFTWFTDIIIYYNRDDDDENLGY